MLETPATLLNRLCHKQTSSDWERFVRLFTPLLKRWAARLDIDDSAAEDLLQDVFILLIRELPKFQYDPARSFRGWLWTVFRHSVLAWRKRQPKSRPILDQFDELTSADSIAEATEVEYRSYLMERIIQIVQSDFSATTWLIFQRVAMEGRTGAEVAQEFDITVNAVYLIRSRVVARLREDLAGLND